MEQSLSKEQQVQVSELRSWVESQSHLPKNIDIKLIIRFLHSNYYNMEKAKSSAELFFTLRASCPEILTNRDPLQPSIQKTIKIVNQAQYQIAGNTNVWVWQLNDPGLENYDYVDDAKLFFLGSDAWLLSNEVLQEQDIVVMDVKDISLKFLTKMNISVAKKLARYQEDAIPIRIKAIHIINSPNVIDKLYAVIKPFLKQDMTNMVHFHTPKSTTLFDYLKKEELPSDFGGTLPSVAEYKQRSVKSIMDNRTFFLDDSQWKSTKKDKSNKIDTIETGTFRTLSID